MNITDRLLTLSERLTRTVPKDVLTHRTLDFAPRRRRDPALLTSRSGFLSRGGSRPSATELERLMGTNDLVDEFYLERTLLAALPVCRLSIRSDSGHERGCATGFMVSPRLLLTNNHVFTSADEAAPSIAEFNYRSDIAGNPETSFRFGLSPSTYFFTAEDLDFALVAVAPVADDGATRLAAFGYHRLIQDAGKITPKEWMTIIQHPGGARRQFAIRENQCLDTDQRDVLLYKSDTAQGSSGSPVFNDSLQVVALHQTGVANRDAHGKYLLKNGKKVAHLRDVDDDAAVDWIANAGIRISRICATVLARAPERNGCLAELRSVILAAPDGAGDILTSAYQHPSPTESSMSPFVSPVGGRLTTAAGSRLVLGTLVLELGGGMAAPAAAGGTPQAAPGAPADQSGAAEALKKPFVDDVYTSRKGFQTDFLGVSTPLLTVTDPKLIAPMKKGGTVIRYEHFSVVLHKQRRLAIFTAANVDGNPKARRPEAGHKYDRKSLTGLGKDDREEWLLDPRVAPEFQIPDRFYTKDNGAFDKGHIVRREDVCFGKSFAQVRRANGDTFHLTNCSPQRAGFNQSGEHGIWGQLENFIAAQAKTERFCIFAGPVLDPKDETFDSAEHVQLPKRFWKVVCAVKNKKLQVFPFVLEQSLEGLPLEFQIDAKWSHKMVTVPQLEKLLRIVKFPKTYHTADQG